MKVMFGVPTYRGLDCLPFLDSLKETTELFLANDIDCMLQVSDTGCYVQVSRNRLAQLFLESDCDKLLFLDDDVSWDPRGALEVVLAGHPIVGGVYPQKDDFDKHAPFAVVLKCSEEGIPLCDGPYLRATHTVGGFTCVDRSVFEQIQDANPHLRYYDCELGTDELVPRFDFFPQGVHRGRWVGEDYAFCEMWWKLGGEIVIVPDITFGHHRNGKSWYGNLWRYIKQLPGGADHGKDGAEKALWSDETDGGPEREVA